MRLLLLLWYLSSVEASFSLFHKSKYFRFGDEVDLYVNKIESDNTQLPYAYYSLPFVCPPMNGAKPVHLSLGEILRGDRIWQSGYKLQFGIDYQCVGLCDVKATQSVIRRASNLIKDGYVVHWSIDGLPGATTFESDLHRNKYYAAGFPLGFVKDDVSYMYNHVVLVIRYNSNNKAKSEGSQIVGFEVYPKSVSNEKCPGTSKDYENFPLIPRTNSKGKLLDERTLIPYTYSVYWREDKSIDYDARWNMYYQNESNGAHVKIHWFSLANSVLLIFLGSLIVMVVLVKILKKDLKSPSLPTHEQEITLASANWKIHIKDINSTPVAPLLLTTLSSCGIQMLIAMIGVLTLYSLNLIGNSHSFFNTHQGAFFSLSIFCFIISGLISSFVGINLYKFFRNKVNQSFDPIRTIVLSLVFSSAIPAILFILMFILNLFVWAKESSTALPFGTIVIFLLMFILIQCPLGIVGGFFGNRLTFDVEKTNLSQQGPILEKQDFHTPVQTHFKLVSVISYFKTCLIYGLVPFGIVYVELLFIFNSVWLEKTTFYYMYGFLFITTLMLLIIIIESTIIAIYISLAFFNSSDWSWLSFQVGSSVAWYIYAYSIYYFWKVMNVDDFISSLLYFSYMALACFIIGIACGSVAVLTGLIFIGKVYRSIKIE
ncbi:hypothetical protein KGF56_003188 [Candida oxycetoniae]|uniref:Transmembrane 9 superfamily member n=1 Tax=Candida oxycetoniae TaxID=497107 RepID=A0AAI9SW91_9ASCO|nr:uncharacterized protein KGF56_003188 [Candida oxycetoniae]KAI3404029.2 hypothetical protein KGF56_003188 [Candida oxycetoniae]